MNRINWEGATVELHEDIGYAFRAILCDGKHVVDVQVFEHWMDEKEAFQKKGSTHSPDPVYSIDEAEVFVSGYIKWDGCANLQFEDKGYLHFCSKEEAENVGKMFGRLYDLAKSMLPTPDW